MLGRIQPTSAKLGADATKVEQVLAEIDQLWTEFQDAAHNVHRFLPIWGSLVEIGQVWHDWDRLVLPSGRSAPPLRHPRRYSIFGRAVRCCSLRGRSLRPRGLARHALLGQDSAACRSQVGAWARLTLLDIGVPAVVRGKML